MKYSFHFGGRKFCINSCIVFCDVYDMWGFRKEKLGSLFFKNIFINFLLINLIMYVYLLMQVVTSYIMNKMKYS